MIKCCKLHIIMEWNIIPLIYKMCLIIKANAIYFYCRLRWCKDCMQIFLHATRGVNKGWIGHCHGWLTVCHEWTVSRDGSWLFPLYVSGVLWDYCNKKHIFLAGFELSFCRSEQYLYIICMPWLSWENIE